MFTPMFFFGYSFFAFIILLLARLHWQEERPVTTIERTWYFGGYGASLLLLIPATLIGLH